MGLADEVKGPEHKLNEWDWVMVVNRDNGCVQGKGMLGWEVTFKVETVVLGYMDDKQLTGEWEGSKVQCLLWGGGGGRTCH